MKKFYIQTLGCKVNQFESDGISAGLENSGWIRLEHNNQTAQVVIINTCAVTSKAGMQSRQAIRKIIRENPHAKVIVTGCHAQTDPEQIKDIDNVDHLVCHKDKMKIAEKITSICENQTDFTFHKVDHSSDNSFHGFDHVVKSDMTRAYLKIQDGCNAFCTYCIVPYARGSSVSMEENEVFKNLAELEISGFKEVILTGIHTGMYGLDLHKKTSLAELLEKIDAQKPVHRIRLSSIEPGEINQSIINMAMPGRILCNHFHIPLQSGDDSILTKMKRPYSSSLFENIINKINEQIPGVSIGVDTLIGFPSETDEQFEKTYNLIEKLPVAYLHVFPFSARKGTPAWHFKPKVDSQVIKDRCAKMRMLDIKKRETFIKSNIGKTLEGLVQNKPDSKTGSIKAVTSNYLTVHLDIDESLKGKIVNIMIEDYDENMTIKGKLI